MLKVFRQFSSSTRKDSSGSDVEVIHKPVGISVFSLIIIGFFWISGGIYGNEELILVASPKYALPALVIASVLYGLPLMLITAELASALPYEGGSIAWVKEACGTRIGGHNAYWVWVSYTLDASLYPRFAASYLAKALGTSSIALIADIIIIVVTIVKLIGTTSVIKFSTFLSVLSIVPSLLFLAFASPNLTWDPLIKDNGDTNWDELITWSLWLYSGVFSMGSVAKEVANPERAYVVACVVLLTLDVFLINFLPLWVSLSVDPNRENYSSGHFADLGGRLAGEWLRLLLTVGAQVSQIGLYNSGSMAADRYLAGVIQNTSAAIASTSPSSSPASTLSDTPREIEDLSAFPLLSRQRIYHFFFDTTHTGAPRVAILLNCVVHFFVAWLPITSTLSLSMVITSFALILFVASFLKMKFRHLDLDRKFHVPGGNIGAIALAIPCVGLSVTNIVLGVVGDGFSAKVVFLGAVVGAGLIVHLLFILYSKFICRKSPPTPEAKVMEDLRVGDVPDHEREPDPNQL